MLAVQQQELSSLPFGDAAPVWLEMKKLYIQPVTYKNDQEHILRLDSFFEKLPLKEIHWGHIHEYQKLRMQTVGNGKINKECSVLQQVMKASGDWQRIAPHYKPLPVDRDGSGQSLMPEQEQALTHAAENVPKKQELAGKCVLVMLAFGRGFGELSRLRRKAIDLKLNLLHWPPTKNMHRAKTVPIPKRAIDPLTWIIERWEHLGGASGEDFILPHRAHQFGESTDFTKPMGSIKRAWASIIEAANKELRAKELPEIPENFRIYDCRVHTISKALSSGKVSEFTAKKIFGHVSEAMLRRYYKPQLDLLRDAMEIINS